MIPRGKLLVISGPSGVGKGTICTELRSRNANIAYSVSSTTRPMRAGEIAGVHYCFLTAEEFLHRIDAGEFLEWAEVYGNYYGTEKAKVEALLNEGRDVILEIDTVGAANVKKMLSEAISIFIMPPCEKTLEERLRGRATDSNEVISRRLSCFSEELNAARDYDYRVINDDVNRAVQEIEQIIANARA